MITIHHYGCQMSELARERQIAKCIDNNFAKIHVEILLCADLFIAYDRDCTGIAGMTAARDSRIN